MSSQLRVDKILPVDGAPTGGGGGIIQVVQTIKKDQFTTASTVSSGGYVDSNLSATITPKFATSKILILVMNTVQQQGNRTRVTLHCSATGGTIHGSSNGLQAYEGNAINMACNLSYLHSPNTTSAVTYKLQYLNTGGSQSFLQAATHKGSIILMEVSG